jgi:ABC-type dipeptide/oligopeptide/nickel transport system permease subunit
MSSTWAKRWWQPLRRQPSALAGLTIVGAYILLAVFAPLFATHDPILQDFAVALQPPSLEHWLGTDSFGQDVYSRVLYGARLALWIGFASVFLGLLGGMSIGLIAGLVGGRIEWALMRVVDSILAFPEIILAMAFIAVLGLGIENLIYALAVSFVGPFARIVRSDVLQVKALPFIEAAQLMGVTHVNRAVMKPNIVFILADDLSYQDLGGLNKYEGAQDLEDVTPTLTAMAKRTARSP